MANRLEGKYAVVTGAASGMGKAIALDFLKEGAYIVGADVNEERLEELISEAKALGYGDKIKTIKADITDSKQCEAVISLCVESFGTCNVLSHNAGIIDDFSPIDKLTDELWDRLISINATGVLKMCRAAVKYFLANEIQANLVVITSNAGAFEVCTGGAAYCASKAAANSLVRSIAYEYGNKGIRCNAICPGPIASNISESAPVWHQEGVEMHLSKGYNAHCHEWMVKDLRVATPQHISPLAVYLASDESYFVNGDSILIDGGVCLG